MQKHRRVSHVAASWTLLGLAALSLPLVANGQTRYRVRWLGNLGPNSAGQSSAHANAINQAGDIAGWSWYDTTHSGPLAGAFLFQNGVMTSLGTPDGTTPGGGAAFATAINDSGAIVGSTHNTAFLYQNGAFTLLGNFGTGIGGDQSSYAHGINNAGDIVGESLVFDSSHNYVGIAAFLYHNSVMTPLTGNFGTSLTGGVDSVAYAINDAGDIVGYIGVFDSAHNSLGTAAFLYHNGVMTSLGNFGTDSRGAANASANAINNAGDIVGYSDVFDSAHTSLGRAAFLYHNGALIDLGNLGKDGYGLLQSVAYAINNHGDIVGSSNSRAFLYHDGTMLDLNNLIPADSGWQLRVASGINDAGQICGYGHKDGSPPGPGLDDAFVLDPLPVAGDFNGDGQADLLWQNPDTGQTYVWMMNDRTFLGGTPTSLFASPDWQVIATPDLNGDGKPDLLWQNSKSGDVACWLLDGSTVVSGKLLASGVGTDWRLIGTADFNHDGKPDLLWWNASTGSVAIWYLNGTTVVSGAQLRSHVLGWTLTGVMPHLADSNVSLLWRNNTNGDLGYWVLNDRVVLSGGLISQGVPPEWQVAGMADLDGDGEPDMLWQNQVTGEAAVWYMRGATVKSGSTLAGTRGTNWKLIGAR